MNKIQICNVLRLFGASGSPWWYRRTTLLMPVYKSVYGMVRADRLPGTMSGATSIKHFLWEFLCPTTSTTW